MKLAITLILFAASLLAQPPSSGGVAKIVGPRGAAVPSTCTYGQLFVTPTTFNFCQSDGSWATLGAAGEVVYPGAGVANSTGSAWGTSYAVSATATANALAQRNASGEVIAANTVATGKTPMATDTALADAQLAAKHKTRIQSFTLFDPVTTDSGRAQVMFPYAVTVTSVSCSVKAATSAAINLDERAFATPDTAGTAVLTADLTCDADGATSTTFTNAGIAANVPLALTISAVTGTPDTLRVFVTYSVD